MLVPGAAPGPRAAAPPPGWPGPEAASATASSVSAATTAAAAAAAAACPDRVRHHDDLGGSSGLGNPCCPHGAVRCATLARGAAAAGALPLASPDNCSPSPGRPAGGGR